jgi:hypothetical protein
MCRHTPACPLAVSPSHSAAQVVIAHPQQGWSLLCNGVVVFDDYGEILPDGRTVNPPTLPAVRAARTSWIQV